MVIEHNRIILRPLEPKDSKDLYNVTHDQAVHDYVPNAYCISESIALENITEYYSNGDFIHDFYYAIVDSRINQMVGALIVTQNCDQEFEVCTIIGKEFRRKGYITNALKAYIGSMPKDSKLVFFVRRSNIASINSLTQFGMTIEPSEEADIIKYVYVV